MLEKIVVDDFTVTTVTDENTDQCEIDETDMDNIHTSEIGEQVIFKA